MIIPRKEKNQIDSIITVEKEHLYTFFETLANESDYVETHINDAHPLEGKIICERCNNEITSDKCCRNKIYVHIS